MTGTVSDLIVCPKCNNVTSYTGEEKPKRCTFPTCNYRFRQPDEELAQKFSWPKDPAEQFFEMTQQLMEKMKDRPLNELVPTVTPEEAENVNLSNKARLDFIKAGLMKDRDKFMLATHPDDVEGWFKSLHYLMTLSVASGNVELVKKLVVWGDEIGVMAKGLREYLTAGGKVYEKTDK